MAEIETQRYELNKPIHAYVDGEKEQCSCLVVRSTPTAGKHLFAEALDNSSPEVLVRRLTIKPDFDSSGFAIRTHDVITLQYYEELCKREIFVPTGESTFIGVTEFPIAHFVWAKCSDNFKCSRCSKITSSSQIYCDEQDGMCLCMVCEAILGGDVEPDFDFDDGSFEELDNLDF